MNDAVRSPLLLPRWIGVSNRSWSRANRDVIWGWKRDDDGLQRIIFFSGRLSRRRDGRIVLAKWSFWYKHRAPAAAVHRLYRLLESSAAARTIGLPSVKVTRDGLAVLHLAGGPALANTVPLVRRLAQRRPRRKLPLGSFPAPTRAQLDWSRLAPVVLYAGSGLSYEAGLPTLATVHEWFGVDDRAAGAWTFGSADPIPRELARNPAAVFARFCRLHIDAAEVPAGGSHRCFARMYRHGIISRILTDNVDNLFANVGVPFERTRGVGLFNDPFQFDCGGARTLLVVGVAADRRAVIAQARRKGLAVIVVNPEHAVSPMSQNLSYLRRSDRWYRLTAAAFLRLQEGVARLSR